MFNEREKLILQILLKNIGEALSIKEIAKATKIKERTLYREIKNLEDSLQRLGIELVKEKSRYILKGNVSSLDSSLFETNFEDYAYSTETRLTLILCFLILNGDTSIKDISEKLMLSYNTVASTITTIEKILNHFETENIESLMTESRNIYNSVSKSVEYIIGDHDLFEAIARGFKSKKGKDIQKTFIFGASCLSITNTNWYSEIQSWCREYNCEGFNCKV